LGARDRVPVNRLVLLGDVHHRHRRAARHDADEQLHLVLEDELLRLADRGGGLGLVVLRDDLDPVAEDAAPGIQLLDGHLDAHRLVLPIALEDADLGAEVADPHDLRLGDGGRRGPHEGGDHREHDDPGYTLHDPLLAGVDDSMRTERTWAIRARGSRRPAGAAVPFPWPAASPKARRPATDVLSSRCPPAKSTGLW